MIVSYNEEDGTIALEICQGFGMVTIWLMQGVHYRQKNCAEVERTLREVSMYKSAYMLHLTEVTYHACPAGHHQANRLVYYQASIQQRFERGFV